MDKLSDLLKEARPLYRQRKRRKAMAKLFVIMFIPAFLFSSAMYIYNEGTELYLSLNSNTLQKQLLEDEFALQKVK